VRSAATFGFMLAFCCVGVGVVAAQGMADSSQRVDSTWLTVDHHKKTVTVTFQLIAGLTGLNGALNFNGFRDGGLTLTVPRGSRVVMAFRNNDGMLPHSAEVISNVSPVPPGPVAPVFARAFTVRLEEGLPPQGQDTLRFVADREGSYLIFCAVPGHGTQGMWIRLYVGDKTSKPGLALTPHAGS
jgi:hypothetical protein